MKLSARMKKILLFMLHPKKALNHWLGEESEYALYSDSHPIIMSFCGKKSFWSDFGQGEKVSYARTFRILETLGLIRCYDKIFLEFIDRRRHYARYRLTSKGKKIAEKIEEEIRNITKEYEYLI